MATGRRRHGDPDPAPGLSAMRAHSPQPLILASCTAICLKFIVRSSQVVLENCVAGPVGAILHFFFCLDVCVCSTTGHLPWCTGRISEIMNAGSWWLVPVYAGWSHTGGTPMLNTGRHYTLILPGASLPVKDESPDHKTVPRGTTDTRSISCITANLVSILAALEPTLRARQTSTIAFQLTTFPSNSDTHREN